MIIKVIISIFILISLYGFAASIREVLKLSYFPVILQAMWYLLASVSFFIFLFNLPLIYAIITGLIGGLCNLLFKIKYESNRNKIRGLETR